MNYTTINIGYENKMRARLVQETLFSYNWKWAGIGYKILEMGFGSIHLEYKDSKTFTQSFDTKQTGISSEEFLNNPQKYLQ